MVIVFVAQSLHFTPANTNTHTVRNTGTVLLMSCPVDLETVAFPHFCLNFKCWESQQPPPPTPPPSPPLPPAPPPPPLSFLLEPTAPSIGVPVLHAQVCRRWRGDAEPPERILSAAVITIPLSSRLSHVLCKWKREAPNKFCSKWREWEKTCLQH